MFGEREAASDLRRYRRRGPSRTTRVLIEALIDRGVEEATLLDIGGGIGAIPHALLSAGASRAIAVDASSAYLRAARDEAERQGRLGQIELHHGDLVELAPGVPRVDVVTLDRAICCYPDMPGLVRASAERAVRLYAITVPRDAWWNRLGVSLVNLGLRLRGRPFRTFVHPTRAIERALAEQGLERDFLRTTPIWQVEVYVRRGPVDGGIGT